METDRIGARFWRSKHACITAWEWSLSCRLSKAIGPTPRHLGDKKLHRAYESEVADQNVWQSFMLVSGFFCQVFHFLSGEICAV